MRRADTVAPLRITFASPEWTGSAIPRGAQCRIQGGTVGSPGLVVDGIPPTATDIIVAFNDRSYPPLATDGGHGKVRVPVPAGAARVAVPSVPSESMTLPANVFIEAPHRGDVPGVARGAYLAPCSGGRGNTYEAQVFAVVRSPAKDVPTMVVGEATIVIGRY